MAWNRRSTFPRSCQRAASTMTRLSSCGRPRLSAICPLRAATAFKWSARLTRRFKLELSAGVPSSTPCHAFRGDDVWRSGGVEASSPSKTTAPWERAFRRSVRSSAVQGLPSAGTISPLSHSRTVSTRCCATSSRSAGSSAFNQAALDSASAGGDSSPNRSPSPGSSRSTARPRRKDASSATSLTLS